MIYCNHQNYKKRHGLEESSQKVESTYEMRVRHRGGQHGWILRGKEEKNVFLIFSLRSFRFSRKSYFGKIFPIYFSTNQNLPTV